MKKVFLLFFCIVSYAIRLDGKCFDLPEGTNNFVPREQFGRSFMFTRPIFLNLSTEQAIWHDEIYTKPGPIRGSLQVIAAYQHSREHCQNARYFLLPCQTNTLLVAGDNTSNVNCRDIRAEWLNLPSDFNGVFSLSPEQSQWGIIAEYNQDIGKLFDIPLLENWWVAVELPIVGVANNLNLKQHIFNPGTPNPAHPDYPSDIKQAFNQPTWKFGKIDGKRSRVELAGIWLKLGGAYMKEYHQIAYYSGFIFPTSSKQNPEYLFDPVTGFDGHVALNAGVNFNILLNWDPTIYAYYFFLNLEDIFLVRNDQCRTFGLRNREHCRPKFLSRFVQFNKNSCVDTCPCIHSCPPVYNEPGVNVLTLLTRVKPFNMVDFSTGFRFKLYEKVEIEVGFDIWGHTQEKLEIRHPWEFKPVWGIAGHTDLSSASASIISCQATDDQSFTPIHLADLDLHSAASGSVLNYKAHGSIGAEFHGAIDTFFGLGWFLDFPQKNAALKTWCVWTKFGASF